VRKGVTVTIQHLNIDSIESKFFPRISSSKPNGTNFDKTDLVVAKAGEDLDYNQVRKVKYRKTTKF
jgi:hypothetical protein